MKVLDTNVLAWSFIDDADGAQSRASAFATFDQRPAKRARRLALASPVEVHGIEALP